MKTTRDTNLTKILNKYSIIIWTLTMLSGCTETNMYIKTVLKNDSKIENVSSALFMQLKYYDGEFGDEYWCGQIKIQDSSGKYGDWKSFYILEREDGGYFTQVISNQFSHSFSINFAKTSYNNRCQYAVPAPRHVAFYRYYLQS